MAPRQPTAPPTAGEPFLGVVFDPTWTGAGVRLTGVQPGPVMLAMQQQLGINIEQDLLVAIDNTSVSTDNFLDLVSGLKPDQVVRLAFTRREGDPEQRKQLAVTVGARQAWTGPINKIRPDSGLRVQTLPDIDQQASLVNYLEDAINAHGLTADIDKLHQLFAHWQSTQTGYHVLSRTLFPFRYPMHLLQLEQAITDPFHKLQQDPTRIFTGIGHNLDLAEIPAAACSKTAYTVEDIEAALAQGQRQLNQAFIGLDSTQMTTIREDLEYLLIQLGQRKTLPLQLRPDRSLNALNASMSVNYQSLLASASAFSCLLLPNKLSMLESGTTALPAELRHAVQGTIAAAIKLEQGWLIYGGRGNNRYDMSRLAAVIDPNGNDSYYSSSHTVSRIGLIVDQAGNDEYVADQGGPGSAWLGVSILVDHAGNDTYTGKLGANGVGMMGIGILLDYAGQDSYQGDYFSNGAAFYGAGLLLDLGTDADSYRSSAFSQGLGGPRGFGLLYDRAGNDLYLANYVLPSVYGTPSVYASFSQGFGFGIRHYDSGGIGVIVDENGDDRYDAGEFSQAGAYYWGLGILRDRRGHDRYQGNRYSQGFGVHQASGILVDERGNDNYSAMTAACQGAAWDVAIGLLLDQEGNDSYRGDGLCQGAAAMQAQAWLLDLQGRDHYVAAGPSVQGVSGRNGYHYDPEAPVFSWSLLLDTGSGNDFFSSEPGDDGSRVSNTLNPSKPADSRIHGLFIDEAANEPFSID